MNDIKVIPVEIAFPEEGYPLIVKIEDELNRLTITVKFNKRDSSSHITFENILCYNKLNENDLIEFWDNELNLNSWFWNIEKGNWTDQLKTKSNFINGLNYTETEYLILGKNYSIKILAFEKPKVIEIS